MSIESPLPYRNVDNFMDPRNRATQEKKIAVEKKSQVYNCVACVAGGSEWTREGIFASGEAASEIPACLISHPYWMPPTFITFDDEIKLTNHRKGDVIRTNQLLFAGGNIAKSSQSTHNNKLALKIEEKLNANAIHSCRKYIKLEALKRAKRITKRWKQKPKQKLSRGALFWSVESFFHGP